MTSARFVRTNTARLAATTAALLIALAGGCGGGDSESLKKIEKAEQTVSTLTADGTFNTLADDSRRTKLDEIFKSMSDLAQNGPESVRPAALSIAARAKAGLAALHAKEAVAADAQLDAHLFALRNGLNTFALQKSIAEANTGAGTRDLIQTLQASLAANKKLADEARHAASLTQAAVDELSTRQKAVSAQAAAKRQEATSIAATMQNTTATQGLEILKRSTAVQAEADALEQQAADLATQLGLSQSELARARATAGALDEQTKQIQRDIEGAQGQLVEEQKLAEQAGKAAQDAAANVKATFDKFTAFRKDPLDRAHLDAANSAEQAGELARQANGKGGPTSVAGGNSGKLAVASMRQGFADALVSQARALDQIAGTLALLGSAQPPLPQSAEYAAAAAAAREEADKQLTRARDVYAEVRDSISGINDDKLKARIAETCRILDALSSKQGVKAVEPGAPAAAPSDAAAPAPAPAADAEVAAVKKLIDQIHDKGRAGDQASVISGMVYFEDDAQRQAALDAASFTASLRSFDKLCRDKLNSTAAEAMGPMGMMIGKLLELEDERRDMTSADYTVTVEGETATATEKNGTAHRFVKRDGKWMATFPKEAAGVMGSLPPGALKNFKTALEGISADINSGKITTKEQVQTLMMAKLGGGVPAPGGGGADPNK